MKASLFTKRFDTSVVCDVSEDFTLPDYRPEMRRVIGAFATPTVDGKYLSGDELEVDGGVTYTVLYVSSDGEIAQTSQTSSYTGKIPVKTDDDRFTVGDMPLGALVDGVTCRLTGPRKFTLSSRVKLNLLSQRATDASLKVELPEGSQLRRKTEGHKTAAICEVRKNGEVGGEIREREGMRVIMARGELSLGDVRLGGANKSEATVKGDAYVTVLLMSPEGEFVTARGRAPIEEGIGLPDMKDCCEIRPVAFGNVVMIEIETGEDGNLSWQMEYDIDLDLMKCIDTQVTTDAYMTGCEDKAEVESFTSYTPAGAVNGRLTTSATARLRPDMTYVCSWGGGYADKCEIAGGRMCISGNVKITIVTAGGGEVIAEDLMIPLKYECEALPESVTGEDGTLCKRVAVNVTDVNVRVDGDTMNVTAELSIACIALAPEEISAVVSLSPTSDGGVAKENGENMIRVYVPDEGETPWDVEKRFRLGKEANLSGKAYII